MIDSDIEKKEEEVVDNLIKGLELYKEGFSYIPTLQRLILKEEHSIEIPVYSCTGRVVISEYLEVGGKSFKLKKEYPELDAAVRTLGKCIEKNNELKRKQKELTRLDEVHTMLTGLIYEGRN